MSGWNSQRQSGDTLTAVLENSHIILTASGWPLLSPLSEDVVRKQFRLMFHTGLDWLISSTRKNSQWEGLVLGQFITDIYHISQILSQVGPHLYPTHRVQPGQWHNYAFQPTAHSIGAFHYTLEVGSSSGSKKKARETSTTLGSEFSMVAPIINTVKAVYYTAY